MKTNKEAFLDRISEKYSGKSYIDRNYIPYKLSKDVIVPVLLVFSACMSFFSWLSIFNTSFPYLDYTLAFILSASFSILIGYIIGFIGETFVNDRQLPYLAVALLLMLMSINVYLDITGAKTFSNKLTFSDPNYNQLTDRLSRQIAIRDSLQNWSSLGRRRWEAHNVFESAKAEVEVLRKEIYLKETELKEKASALTFKFRYGVTASTVLVIILSIWAIHYEVKSYIITFKGKPSKTKKDNNLDEILDESKDDNTVVYTVDKKKDLSNFFNFCEAENLTVNKAIEKCKRLGYAYPPRSSGYALLKERQQRKQA